MRVLFRFFDSTQKRRSWTITERTEFNDKTINLVIRGRNLVEIE